MENSKQVSQETFPTKEKFIDKWIKFLIEYDLIKITVQDQDMIKKIREVFLKIFEKARKGEIKRGNYREEAIKCCNELLKIDGIKIPSEGEELEILKNHIENFIHSSIAYKIQE